MQLFVLQIVLQMGVFACNFLCSKLCSRWVFSRATFCAPNRAPDGSFRVQLFVVQIVLQNGFFACNSLWSRRLKKTREDKMHVAPALSLLAKVISGFSWGLRHLAASWAKLKKCAAHVAFLFPISVKFFVQLLWCKLCSLLQAIGLSQYIYIYIEIYVWYCLMFFDYSTGPFALGISSSLPTWKHSTTSPRDQRWSFDLR